MNKVVDIIRWVENKKLVKNKDYVLKKICYVWLKNLKNWIKKYKEIF